MIKSILQTAFHPPQFNERMYLREHCLKKLEDSRDKRLIFIRAGAGFGKTSLLATFYREIVQAKLWFSIPEAYLTADKFIIHLFYGFLQWLDEAKRERWDSVWQKVAIGAIDLDQMITYLMNVIEEVKQEFYLFIDDFQFLQLEGREQDLQALQMFLRFAPANIHFVIASREELPVPVNRYRNDKLIVELTEKELTFEREELRRFLEQNQVIFDEDRLSWLYQKTEGWVAGVCLILYFHGKNLLKLEETGPMATVKEYLGEILADIPATTRDFLSRTSIFDTIPVGICNQYLQISDSQRILDELVESRLLTYRYDEDVDCYYRYHNLLKEYFLSQLKKDELQINHLRLAEVYLQVGKVEMGISHLIKAEEDLRAIELIKKEAPRVLGSSDVNLLTDWLDYLEKKGRAEEPILDLYRGQVRETRGRLDEAQEYYLRAEAGLAQTDDLTNWVRVKMHIAGIYWWKKDFAQCMRICEEAVTHGVHADKVVLAGLYNLMGTSTMFLKNRTQGIEYLKKARELAHESNDLNTESWIMNNLAFTGYLPQGKIAEAIQLYEEALKNFRKIKNKHGLALIMSNLGYIYLTMREFDLAEPLFTDAEEIYLEMGNHRSIRSVWLLKTRLAMARGELDRAYELLQRIEGNLHANDSHMFMGLFTIAYSLYYIHRGDGEKAVEWMRLASEHLDLCDEDSQMVQEMYVQRVLFYILTGEYLKAIQHAEELLQGAKGEGYELTRMEATLLLGVAQKEEYGEIDAVLTKEIAKMGKGSFAFLKKKYISLALGLEKYFPDEELKPESPISDDILRINFFGKFSLQHYGLHSSVEDWSNRKALDLLKFLILHHDQWVMQEEILENFWPHTNAEKGKQTLYVALYTIRRKMVPNSEKSKEMIQSKKGMYRIAFPVAYWIDSEAFQEFAHEGLRLFKERSFIKAEDFLREALRLYQGDFLEENMYDEWTQGYRESYMQIYIDVLLALAQIQGEAHNFAAAVELLYHALRKNPFLDNVHKLVMEYMIKGGQVNEAIQHYREYNELYTEELGVDMPSSVQKIYRTIVTR